MILNLKYPLQIWKSWIYISISAFTMIFILFPTSVLIYLHFQSNILPQSAPPMPLQFQYMEHSGPFAFYNMTNPAMSNFISWEKINKNPFTKIEQVLTIHMKYIKLSKTSDIGGIRLSVFDDKKMPVLHSKQSKVGSNGGYGGGGSVRAWPFKQISMSDSSNAFSLYRSDKRFRSWREVVGKSYTKSVPFINSIEINDETSSRLGVLDYFIPKWILNIFVPIGIQDFFSIQNLMKLLKRNERVDLNNDYDVSYELKYLESIDLLNSYGNFQTLPSKSFSTGMILFDGDLKWSDLMDTTILVELDMSDIFIIDAYIKLDYVLHGFRWWVYWWPGLCFIIGVLTIWTVSCLSCFTFSWIGITLYGVYNWIMQSEEEKETEKIERNLLKLLN